MDALLASEPFVASTTVREWMKAPPPRPALRLLWSLDPVTGKPVARWVVDRPEPVRAVALAVAA
jgi:hypothetical protein